MVMPNDTNPLDNLMGGNLLRWMDVAAGICARRHSNCICVTAAVDTVSFVHPVRVGEIVTITAKATRVFNTSMEVHIVAEAEGNDTNNRRISNEAYFTFVGIDPYGNRVALPSLEPETEVEKKHFDAAKRRREMRLILAGRMKPEEAKELKMLFAGS